MKITSLSRLRDAATDAGLGIRDTRAQDVAAAPPPGRRLRLWAAGAVGAVLLLVAFVMLAGTWRASEHMLPRERLRIATVVEGPFVHDVAAQATVVAAVSPTLFAVAPGTIHYEVQAGATVNAGQRVARLQSPALENEYQRELAALQGLDADLQRQAIEVRRQTLRGREQEDLAQVQIRAAERELQRAQAAWEAGVIAQRDLRRAEDERDSARLAYEHARATAALERESLDLELRARRLARERQSLAVANLKRRVDELEVRSPVAGQVASLAAPDRSSVAENAPLLTVVDLSAFEVEFAVADAYARDIRPGLEAVVSLDGREHAGVVTALSPEVRQGQVTGRVQFRGGQPPGLRQSQRGSVRIVVAQRERALKFERGPDIDVAQPQVFVVRGDRAVLAPVQLGSASVAEVEVLGGLAPGDQVVVGGSRDLRNLPEFTISD